FVRMEVPEPGYDERLGLWRAALATEPGAQLDSGLDPAALANAFRLSGGQIRDAVAAACDRARSRAAPPVRVTQEDLREACRAQSGRRLAELARRVPPRHTWDDLVLPAEQVEQLREVVDQV